jgi:putative Mn2+ efflux pump MntP
MSVIEVFILAIALAIDASVASFSQGTILTSNKRKYSMILALFMGSFQGFMPVIGWYIALGFYVYLKEFDHWVAFSIFTLLGIKFIYEAIKPGDCKKPAQTCLSFYCIFSLSIATSIDALAAGATLSFLRIDIIFPAIIIGVVTFFASIAGFWGGYFLKKLNSTIFEIFGGLLLIALGIKVLIQHLFYPESLFFEFLEVYTTIC